MQGTIYIVYQINTSLWTIALKHTPSTSATEIETIKSIDGLDYLYQNKEERYSQVPRLSDTRYSAKWTKRKWRYATTSPWSHYMGMCAVDVMGVRVGVKTFFVGQPIGIDDNNTFQLQFLF